MIRTVFSSLAVLFVALNAKADRINLKQDLDSLGGNAAIVERARLRSSDNKVSIVQNRIVDRNLRFELGGNYGLVAGADSYYWTQNLGLNLDFHINPKWSVGARYYKSFNTLTGQGQSIFDDAQRQQAAGNLNYKVPSLDYPIETAMGVLNWYPIYGKLNLFDMTVVHFDVYTLVGYGKMILHSGTSDTYAAGGGLGIWLSQYVAMRLEGRYQGYTDVVDSGPRHIDSGVFTTSLGILL